ncbi:MAG TPA: M20/M25/M40 family metallo-hydrolase [Thermoanaerobaculia bacterium]|jgi:acetylornithine deacetylase/succinyl-diaminopimelate desuccinylase-like protein|nr:M20/M25/M40 family metallo-hydrolase [Thermoanaerobaculia bacterium]
MTNLAPEEAARKRRRHRNERIVAAIVVLLIGGIAAGIHWWSRSIEDEMQRNRTYIPKATTITPEILLLQEFVRIDTSTPRGAAEGARWIGAYLKKNGVESEIIESAPDRLNVYARIRGKNRGNGLLLFNHIDVMPPGEGWSRPAFGAEIGINMMWGRGTLDMKGITICQLDAFLRIANSGRAPAHDLVFLATADEETGSRFGMQWLIANRPDVFADVKYGITEGGVTEMLTERITYFGIEVGGKQQIVLTVEGDDLAAIQNARIALEPYMFAREPERVTPEVKRFFRDLAPTRYAYKSMLADIDKTIAQGDFWRLPVTYRDFTQNTLWATAPVRVGDRWTMTVRQANLPDEIPEQRIAWIEQKIAPHGARVAEVREKQGPVPVSPDDTPLFRILEEEAETRYRVEAGLQLLYRSGTDSRFLRPIGIICYGVSPYPVDYFQSISIHAVNERVRLDYFMDGIGYMRNVVSAWAAGPT